MDYRLLGRTGVRVSSLCFGTMSFGGPADEDESGRMFAAARDVGINFFDTANVYNQGLSEEILGRLIRDERDELVIVSKVTGRMGDDPNARGSSRRNIVQAVEASLKRLGTDRLDVYLLHRFDPDTHIEETLEALDDLVRRGLVLYVGASNWAAWQVMKALGISALRGWSRFSVLQPMYNLAKRQAEVEILPMAQSEGLGVITYSPLGGGLLTGKYGAGRRPEQGRLVENPNYTARYGVDAYYRLADDFSAYAKRLGVSPITLAVAWAGTHPGVTAPIIGARDLEQLRPSLDAATYELTAETRADITALATAALGEVPLAHDRREEAVGG